jgi:hypothetical protein
VSDLPHGGYCVNLHHFGRKFPILVDDHVPVSTASGTPLFGQVGRQRHLWPLIVEKAYVRPLCGRACCCARGCGSGVGVGAAGGLQCSLRGPRALPMAVLCRFAKFYGSYSELRGGFPHLAWAAMTGRPTNVVGFVSSGYVPALVVQMCRCHYLQPATTRRTACNTQWVHCWLCVALPVCVRACTGILP